MFSIKKNLEFLEYAKILCELNIYKTFKIFIFYKFHIIYLVTRKNILKKEMYV